MQASSPGNPFDNVEPHRHLPPGARAALWAACEIVLACPGDFAEALAWLAKDYSETAICERLLRESEQMHRSALRQLRHDGDRCNTFPRRKALRAARPKLSPELRLKLLRDFWSCPEIGGVADDFATDLIEHPEKVREWVVRLTVQTAHLRGWRIEGDKVATRNATNAKNVVDPGNVEVVWRWLDEQCRQSIRRYKKDRQKRDSRRRSQAQDRAGRLRQAVADAMETGLPAGREESIHARRVVLLACLLTYQHELKLPGEFGTWRWESNGSLSAYLVDGQYVPGRETALFNAARRPDEPFGPGAINIDVERFAALVRRATSICGVNGEAKSPAPADPVEQAIADLLKTIPETWGEYDPAALKEADERALFLLVEAGMVERRGSFRVRMFGHPMGVEATFTATGEYGGAEAFERIAAGMWEQWGQAWQSRKQCAVRDAPAFHCERIGREQWRLTGNGIKSRDTLGSNAGVVLDYVLKRGDFDGQLRQTLSGRKVQRLPVRGKGTLERMELVKVDAPRAGPTDVSVTNWADGGKVFAEAFAHFFSMMKAQATPLAPPSPPAAPAPKPANKESAVADAGRPAEKPVHNADFTMVNWFGTEHTFALGVQSSAVKALWEEWEKTGLGLHQDTIRNLIDAERDSFRMDTAFRNHPAFGTMIQRCGDGKYKLARPIPKTTPVTSRSKRKRQKRA